MPKKSSSPSPLAMYVRVTGDLSAGVLLHQLAYWFGSDRKWKPRCSLSWGGRLFVAKTWDDLRVETGLTERQLRRAMTILKDRGFVATEIHKFNGLPTSHFWVDVPFLVKTLEGEIPEAEVPVRTPSSSPARTQASSPPRTPSSEPYTETSSENSAETSAAAPQTVETVPTAVEEVTTQISNVVKIDFRNEGTMANVNDILRHHRERLQPEKLTPHGLILRWKKVVGEVYGGYIKDFTRQEVGQFKHLLEKCGDQSLPILDKVLRSWGEFAFEAKSAYGLTVAPDKPVIGFLLKYHDVAMQSVAKKSKIDPVVAPTPKAVVQPSAPEKKSQVGPAQIQAALAALKKGAGP